MVLSPFQQQQAQQSGGINDLVPGKSEAQINCENEGGRWDGQKCIFPQSKQPEGALDPQAKTPEEVQAISRANPGKAVDRFGVITDITRESQEEGKDAIERIQARETSIGAKAALRQRELEAQGRELVGQIGQIQPSPTEQSEGIVPGVDTGEAITVGAREAIPRALTVAGGFGLAGAAAGGGTPASVPLAIGAAAVGFAGSISASILGNVKSQRTDSTSAQQRVLDEGKQTLQDWATQAAADPANRAFYVSQFNKQLQQIQDAHVQMKTDTNADVAKFETAIPNLAEFNSFYSEGGERDALVNEMTRSLTGGVGDLELNFRMIQMADRRGVNNPSTNKDSQGFLGGLIP